jgi:hypothetical protein
MIGFGTMKVRFTMKRQTTTKTLILATAAAAALLALGCDKNKKDDAANAIFKSDGDERVSKFVTVQASNGARNDGMLYGYHFTAGHLNSLGRSKVLLMLDDCENCEPIVVHLVDAGEGDLLSQRKASVELYLKTTEGPNKLAFHLAQPDMIRFAKTESGSLDQSGSGDGAANGTQTSGGGPTSPPPAGSSSGMK